MKDDFFLTLVILLVVFFCTLGSINLLAGIVGANFSGAIGLGISVLLIFAFFQTMQR